MLSAKRSREAAEEDQHNGALGDGLGQVKGDSVLIGEREVWRCLADACGPAFDAHSLCPWVMGTTLARRPTAFVAFSGCGGAIRQ